MNDNILNDELLFENDNIVEENNDIIDSLDTDIKSNESPIIETLDDDFKGFTEVISDGILEEEILDLNKENNNSEKEIIKDNIMVEENDNDNLSNIEQVVVEDNAEQPEESLIDNNVISEENQNIIESIDNFNDENIVNQENVINEDNSLENEQVINEEIVNNQANTKIDASSVENSNTNNETLLSKYGENLSVKEYVCNPAIGRDNEIKQLILTLLTPEKSGILVGKPGIGKTAIVEGLGYQIQKGNVPDALKEYQIHKLNTSSLLGVMPGTSEPKIQVLLNEIKGKQKLILFIDEIHTLIGAGAEGDDSLDFANIFKPGLDRGNIKIIGATTSDEYDRYILTDKAFVRRFQKIEVLEPTKEHTVKIMMGSLPKLEHKTGAKLKYTPFIQEKIMTFIVDLTTEYRRVYELSARYPDVSLTILQQAFSYAIFDNKKEVGIRDVRKAILNTKLVYPDVIKKELVRFNEIFSDIYLMETPQRLKGE